METAESHPRAVLGKIAAPLLSSMLFLSLFYVPVLGGLFNPFAPLPIIYSYFRFGELAGVISVFFSTLMIVAVSDVNTAFLYLLGYGLMALIMSRLMHRKAGMTTVVAAGAAVSIIGTFVFFYATLQTSPAEFVDVMVKNGRNVITELAKTYKSAGMQEEQVDFLVKNADTIALWVVRLLPGMAVSAYLLMAFCNYSSYKFIQSRWTFLAKPDEEDLMEWSPPERMVFLFIAGSGLSMLQNEAARITGVNLLIVTTLLYSVSGVFILQYWFNKVKFPRFLRMIVWILVLLQPFIAVAIAGTGLFDIWFDFRKIRKKNSSKEENQWK